MESKVSQLSFLTLVFTVWDLGCYSDSRTNREFRVSAGNYKASDTSVQQCTSSCAYGNYRYKFAATEGSYCYCGNTMDKVVKQIDSNKCKSVCTGDVCSGPAYIRIFNTSVSIEGLIVNRPGIGFLLEDVAFSSSIAKGWSLKFCCSLDFLSGTQNWTKI